MKMHPVSPEAYRLFHDGSLVLSRVEAAGVKVDVKYLNKTLKQVTNEIEEKKEKLKTSKEWKIWKRKFGDKTKIGSREQLGAVLFKEMGVPEPERYSLMGSADAEVLEDVDLPFVRTYVEMTKLEKLKSTYLLGIQRELTSDGFIHPSYNLNWIITYRSSCRDPNFQNQPNRDPKMAERLRRSYIARYPDWCIGEFDFSGIEVKIATCYHKDPVMIKYIIDPTTDMHRDMAIECFMLEEFTKHLSSEDLKKLFKEDKNFKNMRHCGKNMFVFPEFYGDWYAACARAIWQASSPNKMNICLPNGRHMYKHWRKLGITELGKVDKNSNPEPGTFMEHMKNVESDFWNKRFKVYTKWKQKNWEDFQEKGYLITKTGFRVSGNLARNKVNNTGTQGSAFHCTVWSMIEADKAFRKYKMKTRIIGEIHDSILTDGPHKEKDDVHCIMRDIMTKKLTKAWKWIIVPIEMEAEFAPPGGSWHEKVFTPPIN